MRQRDLHPKDGTNKSLFNRLIKVLDSWQVEMLLTNSVLRALEKINQGTWIEIFFLSRDIKCRNWQGIGCVGHITRKPCVSWFIGKYGIDIGALEFWPWRVDVTVKDKHWKEQSQ